MSEDKCNEARLVLSEFMNAMNAWELKYYPLFRYDSREKHEAEAREELTAIFEHCCHPRSGSRNRLASIDCSDPPDYAAEGREIVGCAENGPAVVCDVTQTAGLKSNFRFTLKKTKDGWKVAKKEVLRYSGKWEAVGF
jgi:NTF2 fold immunity protein